MKILVIDDDAALGRSLQLRLEAAGHRADYRGSGDEGFRTAMSASYDLVFLDLKLPDADGLEILDRFARASYRSPIVMITAQKEMKSAIEAMRTGAFDYLRKPFAWSEVQDVIRKAVEAAAGSVAVAPEGPEGEEDPCEIVGTDERMLKLVKEIGLLSRSRVNILVEGESGTGKELVARALHEASSPGRPFLAINCSAVVPTLFESELFGHEKGAFTGADARKAGKLELAADGTLFLDEVGDLPPDLQAKLLRVLQERVFERVGGLAPLPFAARVAAATNRDLEAMVREGAFRQDLFFRLGAARVTVPPLRERKGDIPLITARFLHRAGRSIGREIRGLSQAALERLLAYDWPGNVRELENAVTRAAAICRGSVIGPDDLVLENPRPAADGPAHRPASGEAASLDDAVREHVEKVLRETGWNITRAARILDISPTTLRKKIADHGLQPPAGSPPADD